MKESLYNVALCYHGIVEDPGNALPFRTYLGDFQAQISHLLDNGYVFLSLSDFFAVYKGVKQVSAPVACIIFDDGLESVPIAAGWLIQQNIPFAVALIARRLRRLSPEPGFMKWSDIKALLDSGFCQIANHTYNMHHMVLAQNAETGTVESAPPLEWPCWVDNGEFLYMEVNDSRWYWDLSIVDEATWAFPLFGTDSATGRPITSSFEFKAGKSYTARIMRLWATLHSPASIGYDAHIQIYINNTLVADTVFRPRDYETRSQWPEREFANIALDAPYDIVSGNRYTVEIRTLNAGAGAFRIYAIPDFSGDYALCTTCTEHDYPPNVLWPARPCIILGDGSGRIATNAEYESYVRQDMQAFNNAVQKYLKGTWSIYSTGFNEDEPFLECLVLGGTYADGTTADTWVRFHADATFTAEVLRIKYASRVGARYAAIIDVSIGERIGVGAYTNPVLVARFAPNWADWHWQDIDITPFTFVAGKDYYVRFRTLNTNPLGEGLVRIYMDQPRPPEPYWDPGLGGWAIPVNYSHEDWYLVSKPDHTDVWPDGAYVDSNGDWQWVYNEPYDGPGKAFLQLGSVQPQPVDSPTAIVYPFGAYYEIGAGISEVSPPKGIHPSLQAVLQEFGIISGWTIWPARMAVTADFREPDLRHTDYELPRVLIYGNIGNNVVLNNIDAYIGLRWPDVEHKGILWQAAVEYDPEGNATARAAWLDFVTFDAYFFRIPATIEIGQINIADKNIIQQQGKRALLIFSNYDPVMGQPNPDIAAHVLDNPGIFIPQIMDIVLADEWDGAYINLEWVPSTHRAQANEFFRQLAEQIYPAGKLLMASVPAITGTGYDDPDWVGWCDYATLVRYVSAMKIMTYTESNESTLPGPHAPNDFFEAVYAYVNKVVPVNLRFKILVGANAYGHVWSSQGVDYVTAHDAIAQAIKYGVEIKDVDGEGYWARADGSVSCYFGTPGTIARAVQKALDNGYGGVGIWKADDGDLLEHFPKIVSPRWANVNWKGS
ncbi:MAG: hypothetical protein H5U02_00550 [Clostridia bacterium]|nr:hypothetical protein [Clostridia bacterium]